MSSSVRKTNCTNCSVHAASVFSKVAQQVAERASEARSAIRFRRGETLFKLGELSKEVYCIESGVVKVYSEIPGEREHLVRLLGPGEVFGLGALMENETHHLTAKIVEDSDICVFDSASFRSLMAGSEELSDSVCMTIWHNLKTLEENSGRMAGRSVRERMALTLLNLAKQFGTHVPGGMKIDVRLSREEIASLAGTVVESAVRHLSEFKDEGLIGGEGRRLIVLKPDLLKKIAG